MLQTAIFPMFTREDLQKLHSYANAYLLKSNQLAKQSVTLLNKVTSEVQVEASRNSSITEDATPPS